MGYFWKTVYFQNKPNFIQKLPAQCTRPWYLHGNLQQNLHAWRNKRATAVDLNECLKQIKLPTSIYPHAPISELSFNEYFVRGDYIYFTKLFLK